jgi:hypothetical protein
MADEMQVSLPEGVLKPIIQAQVVAALQGQERLIREMVEFLLTQKVRDSKSYKDYPFLEFVCRNELQAVIEASVREWVATKKDVLQREVARQLTKQTRDIATRLVASVADTATAKWNLKIDVKLGDSN